MSTGDSLPDDGDESTPQLPTTAVFRALIETERARIETTRAGIERDNRRSQVMEKELDWLNAQDQRQFEYASATRDANLKQQADRQAFLRRVVWAFSCFAGVLVLAVLCFAFLGDDAQRALAQKMGGYVLVGIAGFGVLTTVGRIIRAFTRP